MGGVPIDEPTAEPSLEEAVRDNAWENIVEGETLRHKASGKVYVVVRSDYPVGKLPQHTVVRAVLATNPSEWEKV